MTYYFASVFYVYFFLARKIYAPFLPRNISMLPSKPELAFFQMPFLGWAW
jgi:hypothetical protein